MHLRSIRGHPRRCLPRQRQVDGHHLHVSGVTAGCRLTLRCGRRVGSGRLKPSGMHRPQSALCMCHTVLPQRSCCSSAAAAPVTTGRLRRHPRPRRRPSPPRRQGNELGSVAWCQCCTTCCTALQHLVHPYLPTHAYLHTSPQTPLSICSFCCSPPPPPSPAPPNPPLPPFPPGAAFTVHAAEATNAVASCGAGKVIDQVCKLCVLNNTCAYHTCTGRPPRGRSRRLWLAVLPGRFVQLC